MIRFKRPTVGRPSKLSESSGAVLLSVRAGLGRGQAAAAAGLGRATLMRWLARGRLERRGPYRTFLRSLEGAERLHTAERYDRILSMRCG